VIRLRKASAPHVVERKKDRHHFIVFQQAHQASSNFDLRFADFARNDGGANVVTKATKV